MEEKKKNLLEVFALGGLNEVGKNCYVLKKNNEMIIVDAGIKFLNIDYSLANALIPNFSYIEENKDKVKAIFITHGHEDHIGAIPYLLKILPKTPVYGSDFSLAILKQKMKNNTSFIFSRFDDDTVIRIGSSFRVKFFRVTHSIPGSFGLIVETIGENESRVVLTGDFKFDWTEIGEMTDIAKLVEHGKLGVDLLLSDSTNAQVKGSTPSEIKVINRLEKLIFEAQGRVIITSFASNVYRLKKIIEIANKYQKKIVLLGSSLMKMMEAIKKASLWTIDNSVFIDVESINSFPRDRLIVFCTGSQGEERAVLNRLANKNYNGLSVLKGDSIILTSSPIVDNRYKLELTNNKLYELGALIYENGKEELLHSSGHACQEDLKLMLKLVKPKNFMPFHGDFRMIKSHAKIAEEVGVSKENIFVCSNGDVVSWSSNKAFFLKDEKIKTDPDYIFNQKVIKGKTWSEKVEVRERMSKAGVFIVLIFTSKNGYVSPNLLPNIFTYGFINIQKNKDLIKDWKLKILDVVKNENDKSAIRSKVFEYISSIFEKNSEDRPEIFVMIEEM